MKKMLFVLITLMICVQGVQADERMQLKLDGSILELVNMQGSKVYIVPDTQALDKTKNLSKADVYQMLRQHKYETYVPTEKYDCYVLTQFTLYTIILLDDDYQPTLVKQVDLRR